MKALTTAGLTKLIQLIKSSFISNTDTVTASTVTLATVATSGSYNDLSNTPTIPTVDQTFDGTSTNAQSGIAIAGELANYVLSGNSDAYIDNGGTYVNCGYADDDFVAELYIDDASAELVFDDIQNDYHSGVAVSPEGVMLFYNYLGVGIQDRSNDDTVVLTVSNGSLAVNGSEVVTGDNTRFDGQWINFSQTLISSGTSLNGSTSLAYRIDLPNDGQKYEVMLRGQCFSGSTAGNDVYLGVSGNQDSYSHYICRARAGAAGTYAGAGTVTVTASYVASGSTNLTVSRSTSYNGSCSELTVIAYRRIGTNV